MIPVNEDGRQSCHDPSAAGRDIRLILAYRQDSGPPVGMTLLGEE